MIYTYDEYLWLSSNHFEALFHVVVTTHLTLTQEYPFDAYPMDPQKNSYPGE